MRFVFRNICLLAAMLAAMSCARTALADDAPLFEQEPFDTIKLDDENKGIVLKVQPLDLPNRQSPVKPKSDAELEIHLLDRPRKAYKLSGEHIVEIKLFERMVLDEAELLTANGKLDEAYAYYDFLERRYPKMAELPASYGKYLFASAGAAYKQQHYEESLAVLWELYDRDPDHPGLTAVIQRLVGTLFDRWIADENYIAARGILREASARLKGRAEPMAGDPNSRLQKLAADWLAKAKDNFKAGHYIAARRCCRLALEAWPAIEGGAAVAAAMRAKYSFIEVGVTATAGSADDWPERRTARLLTRSLAELTRFDGANGIYDAPLLKGIDRAGRRISLTIKPGIHWPGGSALTAADVARTLLAAADPRNPSYRPQWSKLVGGITLPAVDRVEVELQEPIQRAEPWLDLPMWQNNGLPRGQGSGSFFGPSRRELPTTIAPKNVPDPLEHTLAGRGGLGPYQMATSSAQENRFLSVDDYFAANKNQPKEIVERLYPNSEAALAALRKGEVQIVDRIGPSDAESLKSSAALAVEPYAVPTAHLLVFNRRRPMINNATFRRALAHAVDRQSIFESLSHGAADAGSRVSDAIFAPANRDASGRDSASAGPLQFSRSTARVLIQVAMSQSSTQPGATGGIFRMPTSGPLPMILEHPADEAARTACLAIQRQFSAVGLTLKLREQSAASANAESSDADLYYVEWRPLEPADGLGRLIGPDGLGGGSEVADLLSQLSEAASTNQRSALLANADEMIREQTLLIPLYQLTEYIAYRRDLHGVGQRPMTLYQNVEQWQLGGDGE